MAIFCAVNNLFPGSWLAAAAAACCHGGFQIKWYTCMCIYVYLRGFIYQYYGTNVYHSFRFCTFVVTAV
jgi:hypothetical protein